jgi:hypothetical protein
LVEAIWNQTGTKKFWFEVGKIRFEPISKFITNMVDKPYF